MKFLPLVWKNALRNKRRTVLTVLSLAASLFLLTTLRTVVFELQFAPVAQEAALRLITRHSVGFTTPLPISYLRKLEATPGVKAVTPYQWFGGIYIEPKNFFGQFAVDPVGLLKVYPDIKIAPEQAAEFQKLRNAAIVGVRLMERFGWKVGERLTLKGTIFPADLEFVLVGTFTASTPYDEAAFYFRFDYFDEAVGRPGISGTYALLAQSKEDVPRIIQAVDSEFRNSPAPTKTETEREFNLNFTGMLGNVTFLVSSISAVVVFTILLVTAATMGMTIRERTAEFGVLKAVGFTRGRIAGLLIGESLVVSLTAWLLGCAGARWLYGGWDLQNATGGMLLFLRVQPDSLLLGLLLAVVVSLLTAGIPAWRAARLSAADALRFVG
jgi:putative ABC transport system permease protein